MSIQKIIILSVSILISCAGMAQETDTKRMRITGTDDSQPATVCVSVSECVDKEHAGNIIEGLLLRSDIRGRIETPKRILTEVRSQRRQWTS